MCRVSHRWGQCGYKTGRRLSQVDSKTCARPGQELDRCGRIHVVCGTPSQYEKGQVLQRTCYVSLSLFWDSIPVRTRRAFTKDLQHIVSTHARLFPLAAPVTAPVGIPYVFACPSCLDNKKCFQLRLRMRCLEFLFQLRLRMRCPVLVPLYLPILPLLVSRSFTTLSRTPAID